MALLDINTSIGWMRVNYSNTITTDNKIPWTYGTGDTFEGTICYCPDFDKAGSETVSAICDSFKIIGKSGTEYDCIKRNDYNLSLKVDSYYLSLWYGSRGNLNMPYFYISPSGDAYGRNSFTFYNANDTRYNQYDLIYSQVYPERPGYLTAVIEEYTSEGIPGTLIYTEADGNIYKALKDIFDGARVVSKDPYAPGGESGPGGGTGDFDGSSDAIPIPDLPTLSATSTGFITLFNPSAAQLRALADYMWSNSLFDLDTWKKIFADPMDAILGLSIVPVDVPSGGTANVSVGNISTDISMTTAAAQYVEVDCGTLNVNEYWGAYLDYDPYTKAEIYLPYIGTHALAVDDIMGKAVHVVYHIDILSGACAAYVQCGESVLYTFIGQCAASIPITGNDWTNVINGVITAAASIGSMVATGGASAPFAAPALASAAANSMKPNVEKSGSMVGAGGMLSIQTPYLILTRPRQALPAFQNGFMGYPSFMTETLGSLSGYTEVEAIHLENVPCTENEAEEILEYLHGGVII